MVQKPAQEKLCSLEDLVRTQQQESQQVQVERPQCLLQALQPRLHPQVLLHWQQQQRRQESHPT